MKDFRTEIFVVPEEFSGHRLDRFLESCMEDISRSRIAGLVKNGYVRVQGERARKGGIRVKAGEKIEVAIPPPRALELVPMEMQLAILFEDEHLLVLDKPSGLVVHPAAGHEGDTLVNALLAHCGDLKGIGGVERPGIVHRLDKDTSGLLVVAKEEKTHKALVGQFKTRKVDKVYWVLVYGIPSPAGGTVVAPIGRHPVRRKRMAVVEGGKEAVTRYRLVASGRGVSLVEVRIETGRTHQIRVHMHHIGHGVMGDTVYGGKPPRNLGTELREAVETLGRQALHHYCMRFVHPVTGEEMEFISPMPYDMLTVAEVAGLKF